MRLFSVIGRVVFCFLLFGLLVDIEYFFFLVVLMWWDRVSYVRSVFFVGYLLFVFNW